MPTPKEMRRVILRELKARDKIAQLPDIDDLAQAVSLSSEDISDQLDILEAQGAIKANRTMGGGAAPMITPHGKLLLEELEEESHRTTQPREASHNEIRPASLEWDAFVAHASEDKDIFVRPFAEVLGKRIEVWYDEFALTVGDSLRAKIDEGLTRSRFGIVVLSHNFFRKEWPQRELDGLVAKERNGAKVILPIWLDVEYDDVAQHSPLLAGRLAARVKDGLEKVVGDLLRAMGSTAEMRGGSRNKSQLRSVGPAISGPVQPETEVEIVTNGASTRPPDMHVVVKIRHIFGPPVIPLAIRLWSRIIEGETSNFVSGYVEPGKEITQRIKVAQQQQADAVPGADDQGRGWHIYDAPDDLWVFFTYRTLDGREVEIARTFGLERPPNQNLFDVKRPTSHMRKL